MKELHNYGLVRFSQKTGKIDKSMTAIGCGMIQLWALQNTTKTKACVVIDLDERKTLREYIGTADGFPKIHSKEADFVYDLPDELIDALIEQIEE